LLIQLVHESKANETVRELASQVLHSVCRHNADEKQGRREERVLVLVEELLAYCVRGLEYPQTSLLPPVSALSTLMKSSFDVEQRHMMRQFGGVYALAKFIEVEHARKNGDLSNLSADEVLLRRYAAMSLTNLTCGEYANKVLLCSIPSFMPALVAQLRSPVEELCQVGTTTSEEAR
jgi:adenomatosis polyposis coli protein